MSAIEWVILGCVMALVLGELVYVYWNLIVLRDKLDYLARRLERLSKGER